VPGHVRPPFPPPLPNDFLFSMTFFSISQLIRHNLFRYFFRPLSLGFTGFPKCTLLRVDFTLLPTFHRYTRPSSSTEAFFSTQRFLPLVFPEHTYYDPPSSFSSSFCFFSSSSIVDLPWCLHVRPESTPFSIAWPCSGPSSASAIYTLHCYFVSSPPTFVLLRFPSYNPTPSCRYSFSFLSMTRVLRDRLSWSPLIRRFHRTDRRKVRCSLDTTLA